MKWIRQSTAITISMGPALDKTDGVTPETALSPTVNLTKNGGTIAARNSATAITHDADGFYKVELNTTDTNTLGRLRAYFSAAATHLPVWEDFMVLPAVVYDALVSGSDNLDVSVTQWTGTNVATPDSAGHPKVTVKVGTGTGEVSLTAGVAAVNVTQLGGVAQSLTDLKDFADDGYDPATNKVQGVVLADTVTTYTGNTPQTGDAFARLGAPAGVSVSADVAAVKSQTVAIEIDTQDIQGRIPAALVTGRMDASVGAMAANVMTAAAAAADLTTELQVGLATAAALSTLQTDATAIKAKTDNLPVDPADQSDIIAAANAIATLIGTPAVSIAADIADVEGKVDDLEVRLNATRAGYLDNLAGGAVALDSTVAKDNTVAKEATVSALNNLSAAQVNAEVVDALVTDAYADPSALAGSMGASLSLSTKVNWMFARMFRRRTFNKTTGEHTVYNSENAIIAKSTGSDDGTTTEDSQAGAP